MLAPGIASTLSQYATARESRCCTTTLPKRRRSIAALTNPEVYVDRRERASPASRKDASNAGGDMDRAAVGKRMREVVSCEMGARCETDEQRYTGVNALLHSSHAAALDRRRTGAGVGGESEGQGSEGVIQERQLQEQEMGVERNYSAINSLLFQLGKERGRKMSIKDPFFGAKTLFTESRHSGSQSFFDFPQLVDVAFLKWTPSEPRPVRTHLLECKNSNRGDQPNPLRALWPKFEVKKFLKSRPVAQSHSTLSRELKQGIQRERSPPAHNKMSSMDYGNEDEHTGETAETGAWREGAERDTAQFVRPERERGSGTGALSGGEEYGHLGEAAAAWGSECRRATAAGVEAEACDDQHQLTGIRNSQSQSVIPKAPVSLSMSTQTLTVQAESEVAARLGLDTDSSVGQEGDHDPFIAKDLIASNPNPSLQKLQPVDQQLSTTQEMQDRDPSGAELGVMVLSLKHLQASEQPPFGSEKTPLQDSDAKQDPPTDNAERLRCHLPAMSAAAEFFNEPLGPVTPEEDPVNLAAPCETFYGFIKDAHDALLVIEGVVRGILKPFNGRTGGLGPAAGEAGTSGTNSAWDMQIRSGTVIVFAEISSQMKRWRDGERWSPSRAHGPFLLYREVESIRKDSASKGDDSTMEIVPGLDPSFSTKTLKSNTRLVQNGLTKRTITLIGSDGERHRVVSYYNREHVLHLYKDVIGEGYDKIAADKLGSSSTPIAGASTTPTTLSSPRFVLKTPSMSPTLTALTTDGTVDFKALLAHSITSDNFGRPKQPTPSGNANPRVANSHSSISIANIEVEGGKRRRAGTKVKTYAEADEDDFDDDEEYRVAVRPRGAGKQQQEQYQRQQIQIQHQQQMRQGMQGYRIHPEPRGYHDGQQFHRQQSMSTQQYPSIERPPISPFEFSPHQQHGEGYGLPHQAYSSHQFATRKDSFPGQQNLQQQQQQALPTFFSQGNSMESRWHNTSVASSSRQGANTIQPHSNYPHTPHQQQQQQQQYQQSQQVFPQSISVTGNFSLPSRHFSPSRPSLPPTHNQSVYLQSSAPASALSRLPSTLPQQLPLRYEPVHQSDLAPLRQSDRVPSAFMGRDDFHPITGWKNGSGVRVPYHGHNVYPVSQQQRSFTPPTPQHITPPGYPAMHPPQHQQQ